MASNPCEPCNERGKMKTSVRWCANCEESLCTDCTENHRAMKMSRNHHLIDISKKPTETQMFTQTCLKHDELRFEYYCINHDVICCKECLVESHRTCVKAMSIDIASKGAKRSQSFTDSVKLINHALKTANEFTKDRREHIASINEKIKHVKDKITHAKQGWISYLESLETSLIENLQRQKDKVVENVQKEMFETKQIEEHIIKQKDAFEFVEKHGSDMQAFLLAQTLKTDLSDIEEKIATLTEKANCSTFKFEAIEPCDTMKSIGTISIVENPCAITFVPVKKRQSQMAVVGRHQMSSFIHDCDIDIKSQHGEVNIDGITVIDNNMIVLCDLHNSRLLVYNDNNQYQYQINTKYQPNDITTIPGTNMVVVSSINSDYIQFIDIVRKKVYKEITITGSQYGGVAVSDTNLFVGVKGSIHVLDHKGNPARKIKTTPERGIPWYITICSSGNICYSNAASLYCIKPDGEEVFTYNSDDLRCARGVTTDNHDNVYIVGGRSSNNIHRLRPDGTFIDIILKEEDTIKAPVTCCFNRNYRKLYVVNQNASIISVYNVV